MIPRHASAPLEALKVSPPLRACDKCGKAKDEILSRQPWALGFWCYDCRSALVQR